MVETTKKLRGTIERENERTNREYGKQRKRGRNGNEEVKCNITKRDKIKKQLKESNNENKRTRNRRMEENQEQRWKYNKETNEKRSKAKRK
jgi:hypothetical protein